MSDEIYKAEAVSPPSQPTNNPYSPQNQNQFPPNPNDYGTPYQNVSPPRKSGLLLVLLIIAGACVGFLMIIGVLLALLLPATYNAREVARRMMCMNNEKQITIALHNYHDIYKSFPPAYTVDADGNPLHSWRVLILPYIEQQQLYESLRLDEPWDSEYNSQFHSHIPFIYSCPTQPATGLSEGLTPYQFIIGPDCISDGPGCVSLSDITKGTSAIIMLESCKPVCWMAPRDIDFDDLDHGIAPDAANPGEAVVGSYHTGGVNAAHADGSVVFQPHTGSGMILKEQCKIR